MTKKSYLCDKLFMSNPKLTTEHVNNVKNQGFSRFFVEIQIFSKSFKF